MKAIRRIMDYVLLIYDETLPPREPRIPDERPANMPRKTTDARKYNALKMH